MSIQVVDRTEENQKVFRFTRAELDAITETNREIGRNEARTEQLQKEIAVIDKKIVKYRVASRVLFAVGAIGAIASLLW